MEDVEIVFFYKINNNYCIMSKMATEIENLNLIYLSLLSDTKANRVSIHTE